MTAPSHLRVNANTPLSIGDSVEPGEWNALVRGTANASFCHLWEWRALIEDTSGHETFYRAARDSSGAIVGVLPLVRVRSRVFGDHLVSVPFLNYGGPAGDDRARVTLARWALDEAVARKSDSLLLRTRSAVSDESLPVRNSKVTVVLPMPATADELWNKGFNAKFRNKIKRPQRDGMATQFGAEHLDAFYDVFAANMRDLGTPVISRRFFEQIVATFPNMVLIGATYLKDQPVAGGFGFIWSDEFEMTWSSSAREFRAAKPNMLLYWDYMRELIGRGVRRFNFGRSTPGSGTHEFKQSWGGIDEPLPWIEWPVRPAGADDKGSAQLASMVWRRLPVRLTNALGPALARQLPWW